MGNKRKIIGGIILVAIFILSIALFINNKKAYPVYDMNTSARVAGRPPNRLQS